MSAGRRREAGTTTVELAMVAAAFFLIVLGAAEISRFLYTWNTLDRIAQRAARLAAVCPPNHASIATVAEFGSGGNDLLPDFDAANLEIAYLDENFAPTDRVAATAYVRARIVGYTIDLAIPFVDLTGITSPDFASTMPTESLGWVPELGARSC